MALGDGGSKSLLEGGIGGGRRTAKMVSSWHQRRRSQGLFAMSTKYHGTILDHLANSMLYLSTTPLFRFSLNLAYDGHGFSLYDRLGRL